MNHVNTLDLFIGYKSGLYFKFKGKKQTQKTTDSFSQSQDIYIHIWKKSLLKREAENLLSQSI